MMRYTSLFFVVATVGVFGCGSDEAVGGDASLDAPTSVDGATDSPNTPADADISDGPIGLSLDAWFDGYNLIDGGTMPDGGPCGPPNWYGYNHIRTCCNGEICEGFCEGLPDGAARCSCFGIVGGCGTQSSDAWCCFKSRGCSTGAICDPH